MPSDEQRHAQLIAWLEDQGHDTTAVDKILAKVAQYDAQTVHESVFDSIETGKFDLATIIEEALDEEGHKPKDE
jgi:hypothetical protein